MCTIMEPLVRQDVHGTIVNHFINMICEGKLQPGEKLCPEVQMAAEFHVSRNMLREALRTLEMLGIVDISHGRGTFVSKYALQQIANVDFVRSLACNQTISELLETRIVIEPGLAEFAAQRRTASDIELLWSNLGTLVQNYDEVEKNTGLFHLTIARVSRCSVLYKYLESIFKQLQFSDYGTLQTKMTEGHIAQEVEEHRKILECIIDHDGKKAKNMMYVHLVNRYNMLQSFQ